MSPQTKRLIRSTLPIAVLATDEMYADLFGFDDANAYDDQCDIEYERNREESEED